MGAVAGKWVTSIKQKNPNRHEQEIIRPISFRCRALRFSDTLVIKNIVIDRMDLPTAPLPVQGRLG